MVGQGQGMEVPGRGGEGRGRKLAFSQLAAPDTARPDTAGGEAVLVRLLDVELALLSSGLAQIAELGLAHHVVDMALEIGRVGHSLTPWRMLWHRWITTFLEVSMVSVTMIRVC